MKTVTHVAAPCGCLAKLQAHAEAQTTPFHVGSMVECDCGKLYKLMDDQRDGLIWVWVQTTPPQDSALRSTARPSEMQYDLGVS
jgi:hypothetical protein